VHKVQTFILHARRIRGQCVVNRSGLSPGRNCFQSRLKEPKGKHLFPSGLTGLPFEPEDKCIMPFFVAEMRMDWRMHVCLSGKGRCDAVNKPPDRSRLPVSSSESIVPRLSRLQGQMSRDISLVLSKQASFSNCLRFN